jgi:hypothetical protein
MQSEVEIAGKKCTRRDVEQALAWNKSKFRVEAEEVAKEAARGPDFSRIEH